MGLGMMHREFQNIITLWKYESSNSTADIATTKIERISFEAWNKVIINISLLPLIKFNQEDNWREKKEDREISKLMVRWWFMISQDVIDKICPKTCKNWTLTNSEEKFIKLKFSINNLNNSLSKLNN